MTAVPLRRFWIPAFATERGVRTALQCLYVGLVGASENARNLIEQDPSKLDYATAVGNKLTKGCFAQATRWLSRVREFAVNEEVFQKQILEAVRSPARFLLSIREQRPSTTTMNGLVFAKSPPFYDRYYQNQVIDLSMLCPDLGTSMSFRYKTETLGGIGYGVHEFSGVQPIPLVNRIHPFDPRVRKTGPPVDLHGLQQFKSSWGDFPAAARSWSFENYTQIHSAQTGRKQLGITCVLSGKLVGLSVPRMTLQSPVGDQKSFEVALTESLVAQYDGEEARIRAMLGRPVRLLTVFWYGYGFSRANTILPEALLMEEGSSIDEARLDDAIGFVRDRKRVSEQQFLSHYADQELVGLPSELITRNQGLLVWDNPPAIQDRILSAFLAQMRALGESRLVESTKGEVHQVLLRDVIDREKLGLERLAGIVSADIIVSDLLLLLITSEDAGLTWYHWSDVVRGIGKDPAAARAKLRWLRDMSLVAKKEGSVRITPRGRLAWYSANRNSLMASIERFLTGKIGSFDMLQVTKSVNYPESMIVEGLDDLQKAGKVRCFRASWREFRLFWTITGGDDSEPTSQEDTPMIRDTLAVLGGARDSLSTQKVLEMLRESDSQWNEQKLLSTLNYLRYRGWISYEREPSGNEMWLYPRERRITDLFARHPEKPFTIDEMLRANHGSTEETERILQDLASKGQITPFGGYWFKGDWTRATGNILLSLCEKLIRSLIRENGGQASEARLIYELNHFLPAKAAEFKLEGDVRQMSEKMIQALVEEGKIVRKGLSYGLGPG